MNAARLKLCGTLRNVGPTPCSPWGCPIQYNVNLMLGSFHHKTGVIAMSHSNRQLTHNVLFSVCCETNVNFHCVNRRLIHCFNSSNMNNHKIHSAQKQNVNYSPSQYKAVDKKFHCISQTRLLLNKLLLSSFGPPDYHMGQSALCTSSRHLSTLSKTPFLKRHPMHSVPTRSFFDNFYVSLSQSTPVQSTQELMLEFHQWSGLPWWAVIGISTLAIRTVVVLPLAIHQMQVISRLAKVDAEIRGLVPELNKEVSIARRMYGFDEVSAKKIFKKQLRSIRHKYIVRDNCHPFKAVLLVLFQMPLWICLSISLRNLTFMAERGVPGAFNMKNEGLLWFPDLTSPDPILIPLILLALNLTLTHVHVLRQKGKRNTLQTIFLNGSRVISVVVAVAATINPSSVSFYWACSSAFGLGQNLLLASPRVKKTFGILSLTPESASTNIKKQSHQPPKHD